MGILQAVKRWLSVSKPVAEKEFNIEPIGSTQMQSWVTECVNAYKGSPLWLSPDDHIDTVNFAKTLCSEAARLAMLGTKITVDGSARAKWLQERIDAYYGKIREWVEYGCAYGTIILKPNGENVALYTPGEFEVTHTTGGKIDGVVFHNAEKLGDKWYTRLEYHRFEGSSYVISNKCYVGNSKGNTEKRIDIALTPWSDLAEETSVSNISGPLFAVFRTPGANNIDLGSALGLPIFSEAIQELRDLDVAYSRNSKEVLDSKRLVMLDTDRVLPYGTAGALDKVTMPDYIKLVDGDTSTESDIYHEINPALNTETRMVGINALLGQIGFKVGFSNGYFVFNESGGIQTATQVESDDRRTIQFIKDIRDQLEECLRGLIYSLDVFVTLYGLAPAGSYEAIYDFGDLTYNHEEDRAVWQTWATLGFVPKWMVLTKFAGMTEEEAKAAVAEAQPKTMLFGGEE